MLGTAHYPSPGILLQALEASQAQVATVSIRRINVRQPENTFLAALDRTRIQLLPNTSGCYTAKEAVLTAELAREALETNWIKVEVIGDDHTLLPDAVELLAACQQLASRGFVVLPYCPDDPVLCRRLEAVGCAAVMPLAAPIGTGLGIRNPHNLELIRQAVQVPIVVDAGIGTASDAALAIELGADAILLNTAVAEAQNPVQMALAMRLGVEAGLHARLAGRIPKTTAARPSSPTQGRIGLA
jgi:thiazole synthase